MSSKRVPAIDPPYPFEAYAKVVSPLPPEEGGGYLLTLPDIEGCIADGESPEEALANGRDAFAAAVAALTDMGRPIPAPSYRAPTAADASGKFVTRLPKSLHRALAERARAEGVSLNTLVVTYLAGGLGTGCKDRTTTSEFSRSPRGRRSGT